MSDNDTANPSPGQDKSRNLSPAEPPPSVEEEKLLKQNLDLQKQELEVAKKQFEIAKREFEISKKLLDGSEQEESLVEEALGLRKGRESPDNGEVEEDRQSRIITSTKLQPGEKVAAREDSKSLPLRKQKEPPAWHRDADDGSHSYV